MSPFDRQPTTSDWCSIVTMALSHVVSEIFNVEKYRDLEIPVKGQLKLLSFEMGCMANPKVHAPPHVTTSNLVVMRQRVYAQIERNLKNWERWQLAPSGWRHGWPLKQGVYKFKNKCPGDFQEIIYKIPVDFLRCFWSVVNQEVMYRYQLFLMEHVMMRSYQRWDDREKARGQTACKMAHYLARVQ